MDRGLDRAHSEQRRTPAGMGSSLRQRSLSERFRKCLRISLTFLFSQVGLMALVVAYSAAGAVLFEWLEADQEIEPRRKILRIRLDCLHRLARLSNTVQDAHYSPSSNMTDETEWTVQVLSLLKGFETEVVRATKLEGYDGKEVDDAERQWSVSGALLYSITVITTIGYGNLAPKTGPGKVVTILYALIGIPLMLLCLSNLGSFMASSFQFAFGKLYCCFWCSSRRCCGCCSRRNRRNRRTAHPLVVHQPGRVLSVPEPGPSVPLVVRPSVPNKVALIESQVVQQPPTPAPPAEVDLTELTERDYDIVQLLDCGVRPVLSNNNGNSTERYAMDRLNRDARSVLADCSRYYTDSSNQQQAASTISPSTLSNSNSAADCWENVQLANASDSLLETTTGKVPATTELSAIDNLNHGVVKIVSSRPAEVGSPSPAAGQQQQQHRVPVSVVMAFLVGYICLGAAVFSAWEEWSYLDGAYFSFITLSTIGFGDLVPGSKVLEQGQTKLVACIVYLVVGLAMIAMSFNLVQEEVVAHFQRLGQNMGILDEK